MKIGFVIYGSLDTLSGGYLYDRKLVEFLRAQGDEVRVISLPPGVPDRADWRNYAAHLSDNLTFRLPSGLDLLIQDELNHPSLLAANTSIQLRQSHRPGVPPGVHRLRKPYPVISLVHHLRCSELRPAWQNAFYRLVERLYLKSVDGLIFNSQTTRGVVTDLIGDHKPSIVAYPPTDRFGTALPEAVVRARAAQPGPLRIVFLGNVIPRKGLHTLLEAASHQPSAFQLEVIGSLAADPAYAREMQEFAAVNGLRSTVSFRGALDNEALAEKLKAAHVLAVPSSYEGFGIVYLEGMAFGLPSIGTTAGAAGEIIRDGETGYLITPEDAETLAARLEALAVDRGLLVRLSLQALKRYQQQPTWEQTAGEIRGFLGSTRNDLAAAFRKMFSRRL